jgi:hypothetical protein
MNLFPLIPNELDMSGWYADKLTSALISAGLVTMEAQLWAWQRGLYNLV